MVELNAIEKKFAMRYPVGSTFVCKHKNTKITIKGLERAWNGALIWSVLSKDLTGGRKSLKLRMDYGHLRSMYPTDRI